MKKFIHDPNTHITFTLKNITRLYKKHVLFFMLLCWSISALAQTGMPADQPYFVSASWQTGLLFPHHESIMFFVDEPINGFEVLAGRNLNDEHSWHRYYHSPQTGIGIYHSGLGNHEVYGTTTGFFAFFRTGILPLHGRFRVTQSTGAGLAYLDRRFDVETDYFNRAIGSHVNVFLKFTTAFSWQLTSRLKIDAGGSFIHMSNGNIKTPNFGLNLITAQTGLTWNLDQGPFHMLVAASAENNVENTEPAKDLKRWHVNLQVAGGIRESSRRIDKKYPAASFITELTRRLNHKYQVGIGADVFYDTSLGEDVYYAEHRESSHVKFQAGAHLAAEVFLGRLSLVLNPGIYFYHPAKPYYATFNRVGLRYRFANNMLTSVCIKAHAFEADYIEWGVGYEF